jgi:hypothetical protein
MLELCRYATVIHGIDLQINISSDEIEFSMLRIPTLVGFPQASGTLAGRQNDQAPLNQRLAIVRLRDRGSRYPSR